jgi:preprotein translocase subunit SecD
MNKNLGWKVIVIVGHVAVFSVRHLRHTGKMVGQRVAGSIAEPHSFGTRLKGGTHLILQVQVNDAVNVDSDNAVERLKADLRARKINYTEISKPDPVNNPDKVVLKGCAAGIQIRLALHRAGSAP